MTNILARYKFYPLWGFFFVSEEVGFRCQKQEFEQLKPYLPELGTKAQWGVARFQTFGHIAAFFKWFQSCVFLGLILDGYKLIL